MNQPCKTAAWNSGKLVAQKAPLKLKEIWASGSGSSSPGTFGSWPCSPRARRHSRRSHRPPRQRDPAQDRALGSIRNQSVDSQRSGRVDRMSPAAYLFPSRQRSTHLSTRQYARIVKGWVRSIGLGRREGRPPEGRNGAPSLRPRCTCRDRSCAQAARKAVQPRDGCRRLPRYVASTGTRSNSQGFVRLSNAVVITHSSGDPPASSASSPAPSPGRSC